MKVERTRQLTLNVLNRLEPGSGLSSDQLDNLFKENPSLDARDRAFINQLIQGVLRWRLRLDWIISRFSSLSTNKMDLPVLNILRLAVFQIMFLDRVPESAAVNEAVNQVKQEKKIQHTSSFVNGVLRNLCRHKDSITFPKRKKNIEQFLSVYYSYPRWLVEKWLRELGSEHTEELLDSQNLISGLNIRTNTLKITRSELIDDLNRKGIKTEPAAYSPDGIILPEYKGKVDKLPLFRKGYYQIQDQAAQITSHLLNPMPGDSVLDVCAGQGGKSTHLAELMEGKGTVIALDSDKRRLSNLIASSKRLNIRNIKTRIADASKSMVSLSPKKFDKILVDAPCSGFGVLSRHPDGKWNKNETDIKRLARLQKKILAESSSLLEKKGGMLYVTCTITREENEGVVNYFLRKNPEFHLVDLRDNIQEWGRELINDQGFFRSFPHIHHMDGFFAALFQRVD